MKQVTFMMLKPDAFANHQEDEVVDCVLRKAVV